MEVAELSGPQRSLLVINGGSATAVAWNGEARRQERPMCGFVWL